MIYWGALIILVLYINYSKKGSKFCMHFALYLFLTGALTAIINENISEIFFRLSIIGWIVGVILAMKESKTVNA